MKHVLKVESNEKIVALAQEITYGQRKEWCESVWRPLKLSLMRPRQYFYYDPHNEVLPVIVWICGGGFTEMDRNVWMPELVWFAKRGYAVASIEYSVAARSRFPAQIEDVKQAIRFLRANATEFGLDATRFAVMGESAGGYLSALVGASGNIREFDKGLYLDESSAVQAAIPFYPAVRPLDMNIDQQDVNSTPVPPDILRYADITTFIDGRTPPYLILHGDKDSLISYKQSELLYDTLQKANVYSEFYLFEGAEHADAPFYQPEAKQIILDFLNKVLE